MSGWKFGEFDDKYYVLGNFIRQKGSFSAQTYGAKCYYMMKSF